jgi:hypothetical protein
LGGAVLIKFQGFRNRQVTEAGVDFKVAESGLFHLIRGALSKVLELGFLRWGYSQGGCSGFQVVVDALLRY